jgi:glycogen phosphorylase
LNEFNRSLSRAPRTASDKPPSAEAAALRDAIRAKLAYAVGKLEEDARPRDWFIATALAVRDRIVDRWMESTRRTHGFVKPVHYLSVEFLIGRLLCDAVNNLRLVEPMREALAELGVDFDELRTLEPDAALGNGGLGRLAACFMDSMASLEMPAYGYGIRYDYGLFKQTIADGWQREVPEDWLADGNPWEFERPEITYPIQFGGLVEYVGGNADTARALWYPNETIYAVAYDTPIVGWRGRQVNTLRLWSARVTEPLQLEVFNQGDYVGALASRARAEAISRVLYPSDATPAGQELRLRQEFFFTSASLQDLIRRHLVHHGDIATLPDHAAIQLNDTHPAIAVAELMRLLVDVHEMSWSNAWRMTRATLSYTNHTLLPEALETIPVALMARLLPRHLQIIYLLNWHHLKGVSEGRNVNPDLVEGVSLIEENHEKRVRMGHLAFLGSHKVNGVSALHTELMRSTVFRALDTVAPGRIVNKTNGITFRRWLHCANPPLAALLVETLGARVLDDPGALADLEPLADDAAFVAQVAAERRFNKERLARRVSSDLGIGLDASALFDVQIKRIHEYKRQLLNIIETVALYQAISAEPSAYVVPRVKIFAGKAAANYVTAKLIIKLANDVARVVNLDLATRDRLKVAFLPNYNVSLAEMLVPAADLSEQISTAGMEASGTGNMKLALNGALTIGTLDGANVEIRDRVGDDNIFIFGLRAEEVAERRSNGFTGRDAVALSPRLQRALEAIATGGFSPDEPHRYDGLVQAILGPDRFMVCADFDAYWDAQRAVEARWRDAAAWWRASVLNTARMAWFSSDRTIREYADDIWGVPVRAQG